MAAFTAFEVAAPGLGFITLTLSDEVPVGMMTVAWSSVEDTNDVVTLAVPAWISAPLTKPAPSTSSV